MEGREIRQLSEAQYKAAGEKKLSTRFFWWMFCISLGLIVISSLLFFWRQGRWFIFSSSVNVDLLAAWGSFIGGILGTLVAAISIYMVVMTLHAQVDANANMEDTNKEMLELNRQQIFDNKFQVLYAQYQEAVAGYGKEGNGGKRDLEVSAASFLSQSFDNHLVYSLRVQAAVKMFEEFYARNRMCCSVHFRVLYQLARLIDQGDIEDDDRVIYAKSVRGQLTDGEMALLRYNCLSANGKAMQLYVNHFNLLKHVPLMSLLEFKPWSDKVADEHQKAALDATFITLRKIMTDLNDEDTAYDYLFEVSARYQIRIIFEHRHYSMIFRLEENKKAKYGGPVKHPYAESALKKIGDKELPSLFYAFLYETFHISNFNRYENTPNCVHTPIEVESSPDSFIFEIQVKGPNRLVLSQDQYTPASRG